MVGSFSAGGNTRDEAQARDRAAAERSRDGREADRFRQTFRGGMSADARTAPRGPTMSEREFNAALRAGPLAVAALGAFKGFSHLFEPNPDGTRGYTPEGGMGKSVQGREGGDREAREREGFSLVSAINSGVRRGMSDAEILASLPPNLRASPEVTQLLARARGTSASASTQPSRVRAGTGQSILAGNLGDEPVSTSILGAG